MEANLSFKQELSKQRWDDHRFYHHNRINQSLHLVSASCFLTSYVLIFVNPVLAVLVGWMLAMLTRQVGHYFFEPKTFDEVNEVTHEYKESVKVGYNLQRKTVLLTIWFAVPFLLYAKPELFGRIAMDQGYVYRLSVIWLLVGIGAVLFRTVQLFFKLGVQSGLVWATKILTDPFHDVKIYHKAPYYVVKGEMYDDMTDWYDQGQVEQVAS